MEDSSVLETTRKLLVKCDLAFPLSGLPPLCLSAMGFVPRGKGAGHGFGVFLGFSFSFLFWQQLKLLVISEYRTIGELGIQDHSSAFELLSGVSNSEWQRSQLSDRLEISQLIVYVRKDKKFLMASSPNRGICPNILRRQD